MRLNTVVAGRPARFQRTIGLVLVSLLIAETAPAGLARAEEGKRKKGRQPAAAAVQPNPADAVEPQNKAPVPAMESPDAYYARRRGIIALSTGHYDDAVKAFEEAYALNQDPGLLFHLAQAYRLAGQPRKALDACSSFLRSANATTADRMQVERFMAELEMIVFQIRAQKELRQATAPASAPTAIEPPPMEDSAERPRAKPAALDLTPRPAPVASTSLATSSVPEPPQKPFYQRTSFWLLAGGAVAAGVVAVWLVERPRGLTEPTTALGYQQAFP